jgi:hypothetical protein
MTYRVKKSFTSGDFCYRNWTITGGHDVVSTSLMFLAAPNIFAWPAPPTSAGHFKWETATLVTGGRSNGEMCEFQKHLATRLESLRHSSVCFKRKTRVCLRMGYIPLKLGDSAPFSTLRLPQPSPKKPWEQGAFTACHATEDFESRASVTLQLKILGK